MPYFKKTGLFVGLVLSVMLLSMCAKEKPTAVLGNQAPQIILIKANLDTVTAGQPTTITCTATDPDGDALTYTWTQNSGNINGSGSSVEYVSDACCGGIQTLTVTVTDGRGGEIIGGYEILVLP